MKKFRLLAADGRFYESAEPGTLGDCPTALRHIAKGHYVKYRVFFKGEAAAIVAGAWKAARA